MTIMKQDLLNKIILFATGAAVGSITTYILMKKYANDVYEVYEGDNDAATDDQAWEEDADDDDYEPEKADIVNYNKILEQNSYGKESLGVEKPYMITTDEYAELDGYAVNSLYYYEDGILTDENDNVIDDIDDVVGYDALAEFENESIDSVYVRNDARRSDYEILRDRGRYYDNHPMEE